jgi:hypothetical protein
MDGLQREILQLRAAELSATPSATPLSSQLPSAFAAFAVTVGQPLQSPYEQPSQSPYGLIPPPSQDWRPTSAQFLRLRLHQTPRQPDVQITIVQFSAERLFRVVGGRSRILAHQRRQDLSVVGSIVPCAQLFASLQIKVAIIRMYRP